MADAQQTANDNRIRKLRKKLRQIENLQRLCGQRDLTQEEIDKLSQRGKIREQLQELIALALEDEQEMESQIVQAEEKLVEIEKAGEDDDAVAQEKKEAQETNELNLELEEDLGNDKKKPDNEDVNMDSVSNDQSQEKKDFNHDDLQAKSNETDDLKMKKAVKKKGRKNKGENPNDWKQMQFSVKVIEGHHHPLCAVDFNEISIISGGHDTSFKVWNANSCEELFSLGGHTGSITAALLISEDRAVTGSHDCSIKIWDIKTGQSLSSAYVFNPVTCLAYRNGMLAIGNEGGKIDLFDVEKEQLTTSLKTHEDALVSVMFMDNGQLVTAAADGVVKVFALRNSELVQVLDSNDDISTVTSFNKDENSADTPNSSILNLPLRKINCIATFEDFIFWGDDGYNVKAFNTKTGEIVKLRNNLNEYSPTDAMTVLKDGESGYLFSAGFDIDNGSGYINVRKLPSMEYLGTISDEDLGHVSCITALLKDGKIQIVTGGSEMRIWQQASPNSGKKRRASDEIEDVIPCKFNCSYNKARDSEDDSASEAETEDETPNDSSADDDRKGKSWCVVQ